MAALIKAETGLNVDLIVGGRGEFSVWVGDERVACKDFNGFPQDHAAVLAVREALKGSPR